MQKKNGGRLSRGVINLKVAVVWVMELQSAQIHAFGIATAETNSCSSLVFQSTTSNGNPMIWNPSPLCIASSIAMGATLISAPLQAQAKIYVSFEQAQQLLFPSKTFTLTPLVISEDYQEQMRKASSVRQPFVGNRVWRTNDGGWFVVDQVVGKHEMITYALGIKADGSDRKSTRLNSSHVSESRMPSSA